MRKIIGILAVIAFALCMTSCDEIMSFFDKQVNSLVGSIEGVEMHQIKSGGIDTDEHYDEKLGELMKENNIVMGNGRVNTSFNAIMTDAKSVKDLDFTEGVVCVYFHKEDDEDFAGTFADLAATRPHCQFYSFDTDVDPVPEQWAYAASNFRGDFDSKGECAAENEEDKWKVRVEDGTAKTADDGVSFYILSNSKVQMQVNGKSDKEQLEKMLVVAEKKLSYRLKAKKMHWGAGYSIEDHLYDVVSQEDFDIQVNFKVEKEVAEQADNQKLPDKSNVALVLFYRAYPRPLVGFSGSYRTEDYMMGVFDKGNAASTAEAMGQDEYSVYNMNFVQRLPDVKFFKCNAFGAGEDRSVSVAVLGKGGRVSDMLKRDYSDYLKLNETSNIGYDWLVEGIKEFNVDKGRPMYGFMLEGIEVTASGWAWPESEEDVAKLTKLKEEYTRSLWVMAKDGKFNGFAACDSLNDFLVRYSYKDPRTNKIEEMYNGINKNDFSKVEDCLKAAQAKSAK
ncbi:MAG TPA: hypothetical protein DCO86_03745 [Spirochaetaceae bacterium]|nr:hypothetical protein [Spirochaetaceae bacterium]